MIRKTPDDDELDLHRPKVLAGPSRDVLPGVSLLAHPPMAQSFEDPLDITGPDIQPQLHIDGYKVLRKIGQGGMAEIFEATQLSLQRPVAIKLLAAWACEQERFRTRFLREGEAAARLRHRNVIEIYDVGMWRGRPYIIMERLEGASLEQLVQGGTTMSAGAIADLMMPVLSAVIAAHDRGIVHRDLKPENIFLARTDEGEVPKVLDFGISRTNTAPRRFTSPGENVGTPHYMAPEQARGDEAGPHSDQYALGVVLYELATGELPRHHDNPFRLMEMVAEQGFPPPRRYQPTLDPTLEAVILKAMEHAPENRFSDLRAMAEALAPLASRPQRITPIQVPSPVAPAPPKRRRWAALIAVAGLLLGFALAWHLRGAASSSETAPRAPNPTAAGM